MHLLLPALMALAIGMMLPLQGLVNARLGPQVGGPVVAAFISFLIGTALLGAYLLLTRTPLAISGATRLPPWIWTSGLLGALYVACFTLLMPRLGAASLICLAILGQVTASLVFDHFGILQAPRKADPVRIAGAILMIVGVLMVAAPWRKSPPTMPVAPATPPGR